MRWALATARFVDLDSSNEAVERAEQGIREQQEASLVGAVAGQVAAVFANDNVLTYQVQEYDGIMVNAYKAVNLLQQGETDKARVEFKRVEERQRMAAERFKERLLETRTYSRTMALLRRGKKIRIGEHGEWLPVRTNPSTGKMFAALGLDIAASEQPKRRPGRPPKIGTPA